ncbi:hypothetical protein Gocc_1465 [Gaiella occulta]|uniref:Uncharacterized protein n=1 Tax=Gaiella occulta TaxID=1002870 RepID=A0A7M2YWY5_9ACTN|nr:hypothetical protein [Gaiella occulta]RDI74576.1 hypothetical protein Gocc_1465 [Gaiella occulta]
MRIVKAFLLGALAAGLLAYTAAAALAAVSQASGADVLRLALGPLVLVAVDTRAGTTTTTFGSGLLVLAVAGGLANALAATVLARRSR